jgi:hypothetical protein
VQSILATHYVLLHRCFSELLPLAHFFILPRRVSTGYPNNQNRTPLQTETIFQIRICRPTTTPGYNSPPTPTLPKLSANTKSLLVSLPTDPPACFASKGNDGKWSSRLEPTSLAPMHSYHYTNSAITVPSGTSRASTQVFVHNNYLIAWSHTTK